MAHETMHNPASPGELLREFMGDHSATELAEYIGVARATISRILNGRTAITMDLSIQLRGLFPRQSNFTTGSPVDKDVCPQPKVRGDEP